MSKNLEQKLNQEKSDFFSKVKRKVLPYFLGATLGLTGVVGCGGHNNKPPVFEPIGDRVASEGELMEINPVATDPDGDTLWYILENEPAGMTINRDTGKIRWQTDYNDAGNYKIKVSVDDGYCTILDVGQHRVSQNVNITINDNGAPEFYFSNIPDQTWNEDTSLNNAFDLNDYFSDPDGNALTYSVSGNVKVNVDISADGLVSFSQPANWRGSEQVTFTADDGEYTEDSNTVSLNVNNIPDAPILEAIGNKTTNESSLLEFIVNATDADGDTLTYSAINLPAGASFDPVLKKFSWTPDFSQSGDYTIKFSVSDGGLSDFQNITVKVNNVPCYRIAFNSYRDGNWEIYVMNEDSSGQTNLTNKPAAPDIVPVWSPDGAKIAFMSSIGQWEICTMNSDGTNQTRLTFNGSEDMSHSWSPDGTKIVFSSNRDENYEIYKMNADGTNQTNLTNNSGYDGYPAWSPDGTKIAFESTRDGNGEIYIMNADGTNQTRLTSNTFSDQFPVWSPDGKIVFWSGRDGNLEIYKMNADGTNQTNLTNNSGYDELPSLSPDGTKIAFDSTRDGNEEMYVMNADGTNQTRLTFNTFGERAPVWSIDGRIAFWSSRDGNLEIYKMNADGSNQTRLTYNTVDDQSPAWSPDKK